ncbi:MAG: hypothetical protein A2051_06565 [Desulfovibrionales bacterium GWA2_65_9]|nr:MAG: hypothetical protein A2051_06565 [Desulfovibrionales bacterium GWA2_65_9]
MRRIIPLVLLACLILLAAQPALAQRRVALVIGNSIHETVPLKNPANDARAMAATLKALGFEVIHLENASQAVMLDAVNTLGRQLTKGSVGLFYFAGHGVQSAGHNYLIPVSSGINSEADLESRAVDAGLVLERMEQAGSDLNIVILDACRNNPFARKFRSAGGGKGGLAAMQAPKGSLIAFATSPGSVASDGAGENGVYTKHLLQHLRTPDLQVEQMFKRVRSGVVEETRSQQLPWETTSIQGDFAFAGAAVPDAPMEEPKAVPQPAEPKAKQSPLPRSSAIQVEFAMLRENGKKPPTPVKTGDTLKSGDAYFFHAKTSKDCHLYLFQVDSSGTVFRLFPNSAYHTGGNPIRGRTRITLPNEGEVFYLDQTTGKEEFYFLASQEPVSALEALDGGTVDGIMRAGLTLRGPAGVKAAAGKVAASGGEASAQVQEFTFSNSFVHAVTVNHR